MAAFKTLLDEIKPLSIKNNAVYLKATNAVLQKEAARLLGVAPSTLSEWADDHMERALQVLAAYGQRVVSRTEKTYPIRRVLAWKELARSSFDDDDDSGPAPLGDN